MTEYGFWGDALLFLVFIVVMACAVPMTCNDEPSLRPFLFVKHALWYVLKVVVFAALATCAVTVFAAVAAAMFAVIAVIYVGAFAFGIMRGALSKTPQPRRTPK